MIKNIFRLLGLLGMTLMGSSCASFMPGASKIEPLVWYGMESDPYVSEIQQGANAAGSSEGLPVLQVVRSAWTADAAAKTVQGVPIRARKGFCISPGAPPDANRLFDQLVQKKKFVVAYGTEPSLPTPASFSVATDIRRAAAEACEELVKRMGGRGRILNLLETETEPNTQVRQQAIETVAAKYPEVSIAQTLFDMTEVSEIKEKLLNTLSDRGENFDGIISTGGNATRAAAALLSDWQAKSGQKRIRFVGIDTDPTVLEAIDKGVIDATVVQNHFGQGYISCLLLARMVEGWTPKHPYQFIDAGHVIVNRKNITTYQEEVWMLADDIMADIEKKYLNAPRNLFGMRP
jgi:ribose transport system substrate-binding protein